MTRTKYSYGMIRLARLGKKELHNAFRKKELKKNPPVHANLVAPVSWPDDIVDSHVISDFERQIPSGVVTLSGCIISKRADIRCM